jgi:hypothetical protein
LASTINTLLYQHPRKNSQVVSGHPYKLNGARPQSITVNPPDGFAWTSQSLQKDATTTAYAIGVKMLKIRIFGGWATQSSVMLDYIDPTVVPTTADWHFFGWLTPWVGQLQITCQPAT